MIAATDYRPNKYEAPIGGLEKGTFKTASESVKSTGNAYFFFLRASAVFV